MKDKLTAFDEADCLEVENDMMADLFGEDWNLEAINEAYTYHEAGHAVMAILDEGVDLVAIGEHAVTLVEDEMKNEEHNIMVSMAGDVAVRHFLDAKKHSWIANDDRREVSKILNRKGIIGFSIRKSLDALAAYKVINLNLP